MTKSVIYLNSRLQDTINALEERHSTNIQELKEEINILENKLIVEKAAVDAERTRNNAIMEQQQNTDEELRFSPTLSIEQESVSSVNSVWPAVRLINFTKLQSILNLYVYLII